MRRRALPFRAAPAPDLPQGKPQRPVLGAQLGNGLPGGGQPFVGGGQLVPQPLVRVAWQKLLDHPAVQSVHGRLLS